MNTTSVKAYGTEAATQPLESMQIKRRTLLATDIEMEVLFCGICHSDLHSVRNDWGGTTFPIVPGHEILGRVTQVGPEVKNFKVGDLAAVGCIVDSCQHCQHCESGEEQFCEEGVTFSFNSLDKVSGGRTYGGFSKFYVCDEAYVLKMPNFEDLAAAAPLLCAGITVYSPLKHWKAGPGKKVGVIGIGGLGHLAVRIANAMGAEVAVFTRSVAKAEDAKRLGADQAILSTDPKAMAQAKGFDLIIDTVSAKHDVNSYLNALAVDGSLVIVGLPAQPLEVGAFQLVKGRKSFSGSNIGGIAETQEMLDFCAEHQIVADVERINIQEVNEAFDRLEKGDVRYRFVIDMASLEA
ncbi:NAD(P)-dependent alcohol dehydrogenase [Saprospira sp. CCB-QB6]|uniref:NAD(P)-dependent alcohol dehydrogenase n=1 Tax=Saprospira sp. CCB-QB6 TaxID=3023936 RepID=UPI00234BF5D7|nr:NAD(P)-dependent alcohol dehydrogenase [Saprospira sp. CCB-QB6]WCL82361.1 NAD(P)-dependent alcohol dehydrogenase [Saprospira sp. CCB-QB6]